MKNPVSAYALAFLFGAIACIPSCSLLEEKKEENPIPEVKLNTDTLALKTGRGFSALALVPSVFDGTSGANGGFDDGIDLTDMTLDADGKTLHFTSKSVLSTQQDPLVTLTHYALNTTDLVLSPGVSNSLPSLSKTAYYISGSGKMYIPSIDCNSFGVCTAKLVGDRYYSRTNTFATLPRVTPEGEVVESGRTDNFQSFSNWRVRLFGAYQMEKNGGALVTMESQFTVANKADAIGSFAIEPKAKNNPTVWIFGASENKLYVGEVTMTADVQTNAFTFVDSLAFPAEFSGGISVKAKPSSDRSSFAILCQKQATDGNLVSSYTFNSATRKLAANLAAMKIPGLGQSVVDYDFDLSGNLYFDGWANNFQSDSTISIYRASGNEIKSVGEDILRSGSIKGIRCENGKVFAAHVYAYRKNLSSANAAKFYRMAILKMD